MKSIKLKHPDQQESQSLLELLSLGKKELIEGKFKSVDDFFAEMDAEDLRKKVLSRIGERSQAIDVDIDLI